mgnify:CR=1 FL=1
MMSRWYILLALLAALPAHGFEPTLQEAITRKALAEVAGVDASVGAAPRGAIDGLRRWLYAEVATLPDAALRARFLARYPDVRSFDAAALKELLGLSGSPARRVDGIDSSRVTGNSSVLDVLAASSAGPDVDLRHRDRVVYAGNRPQEASSGAVVPLNPAETHFGPPSGAASDAYAFVTLAPGAGPDEAALPDRPSEFATPIRAEGAATGFGPHFAGLEADLAAVVARFPSQGARALSLTHLGATLNYLAKAASPGWVVQFGSPIFLQAARGQYAWRAFITSGGTLGPLRSEWVIAEAIQRNYRRFLDRLLAERLTARALPAMDDALLAGARQAAAGLSGAPLAEALARWAATDAARDAPLVYAEAIAATCPRMRLEGFVFHDPKAQLVPRPKDAPPAAKAESDVKTTDVLCTQPSEALVKGLERSVKRALAVERAFIEASLPALPAGPGAPPEVGSAALSRIVRGGLDSLADAEGRRKAWVDAGSTPDVVVRPMWAVANGLAAALILALVALALRRTKILNLPWPPPAPKEPAPP